MSEQHQRIKTRRSLAAVLLEFLGSMNLAITLLMVIAVASVIGTVLQQNEPYNNYVMKFGPFWFEVYRSLSLYDVYSATWFLVLLGFLLVSTAVCVYRYTPSIIRDTRQFRLDVQAKSLRAFHHQETWQSDTRATDALPRLQQRLNGLGYRTRIKTHEGHTTLAGMKGASSRLGYLFSHVSIVVICIGGLMDGNISLKLGEWRGQIVAETRDLPVSQIPRHSILSANTSSFRGSVNIPEGARANFVFLGLRDGYLVQELPFTIELEEFRIEHYPSGQPKSYESTLIIHDDDLDAPMRKVIAVNHPLIYKGHAIYQASFADGGSKLDIKAWSLDNPASEPLAINAEVGSHVQLDTTRGLYNLELIDFNRFNIFPTEEVGLGPDGSDSRYRNFGPSVVFRLRAADGEVYEYVNYQSPILMDGRYFYLTGVRDSVSEDYRYLHIPLDENGSVDRFMNFLALTRDRDVILALARSQAEMDMDPQANPDLFEQYARSVAGLVTVFVEEGIDAVVERAEAAPEEERQRLLTSFMRIIQSMLGALYVDMLAEDGHDIKAITEQQSDYFDDMLTAVSLINPYRSPLYLELKDFVHVEASGLQITKSPGQNIVYLGCLMLMVGILLMFYVHHRRLWLMVSEDNGATRILFAAAAHRPRREFDREFEFLKDDLRRISGG